MKNLIYGNQKCTEYYVIREIMIIVPFHSSQFICQKPKGEALISMIY